MENNVKQTKKTLICTKGKTELQHKYSNNNDSVKKNAFCRKIQLGKEKRNKNMTKKD